MEIEHNEAQIKDVSIPLFQLQQKVEKLEALFAAF